MMEELNVFDLIKNEKIEYSFINDEDEEKKVFSTDKIYLQDLDSLKLLKTNSLIKSYSDFVALNRNFDLTDNSSLETQENKRIGTYRILSNAKHSIPLCVQSKPQICTSEFGYGYAPKLALTLPHPMTFDEIGEKIGKIEYKNGVFTINIGNYPYKRADQSTSELLEKLFNHGDLREGITCTGLHYTERGDNDETFTSRQYPEFEYNGKKFVRVFTLPRPRRDNSSLVNKFADGGDIPSNQAVWVEVSAMPFNILTTKVDKDGLIEKIYLESEDIILNSLICGKDYGNIRLLERF